MLRLAFIALCLISLPKLIEAQSVDYVLVSNPQTTQVIGPDTSYELVSAVPAYDEVSGWTAVIPGATWLWDAYKVSQPESDQTVYFYTNFTLTGPFLKATLYVASDNQMTAFVNSRTSYLSACSCLQYGECCASSTSSSNQQITCDVTNSIVSGFNYMQFYVTNFASSKSTYSSNPAGLLFRLEVVLSNQTQVDED